MRRRTKLDRLAEAFAEATTEGRFEEAEGWLATAFLAADRSPCPHTLEVGRHACEDCRSLEPSAR